MVQDNAERAGAHVCVPARQVIEIGAEIEIRPPAGRVGRAVRRAIAVFTRAVTREPERGRLDSRPAARTARPDPATSCAQPRPDIGDTRFTAADTAASLSTATVDPRDGSARRGPSSARLM